MKLTPAQILWIANATSTEKSRRDLEDKFATLRYNMKSYFELVDQKNELECRIDTLKNEIDELTKAIQKALSAED